VPGYARIEQLSTETRRAYSRPRRSHMEKLSVNGIDLAYEVRGDGPPLLMLHGFTGSGGDWVHLFDVDALARRWRLIMPDARGHGRSTNPSGVITHRQA